jgi:superfamily II DNA or RNA helicase
MKSYIGKRGYVLIKKYWDPNALNQIKKELLVQPFQCGDYGEQEEPFPVFSENSQKMYIPKYYGLEKFGQPDEIRLDPGKDIDLTFNGTLRTHQLEPISKCMEAFRTQTTGGGGGGGILSLPCGEGKTACACYLISQLKKKTFVLVHKEFLLNQWVERISDFLPNSKIGKIQGDVVDIENKDIVIGMIQSISMKQYDLNLFDSFGFVILDESHRCPSRVFSKALAKINCTYMLGLSATPNRKDGLTKILKWFIGDIIFQRIGKSALNSELIRYIYCCKDEVYCKELTGYYGKLNSAGMINNIASFMPRTHFIVEKTVECIRENNRQVLILSDRKEQLRDIERAMAEKGIEIGYYIGGMKQSALELSTKKLAILATYQMAAEGLDIATIDTIVLATPKTDIEQAVGRIRPKTGDSERNTPLVIDIVDEFSIFENQAFKRLAFYKKKNYEITTTKVAKDGKVLSSYTYSASAEGAEKAPTPNPVPQKKRFGFSKLIFSNT